MSNMEQYHELYERSASDPEGFWAEVAEGFHWYRKWDSVRSYNYDMNAGPIELRWFEGGRTNVCHNCLDRHLGDAWRQDGRDLGGQRAGRGRHSHLSTTVRAGVPFRQRVEEPRCEKGRPSFHLHADGAGSGRGDVGVR